MAKKKGTIKVPYKIDSLDYYYGGHTNITTALSTLSEVASSGRLFSLTSNDKSSLYIYQQDGTALEIADKIWVSTQLSEVQTGEIYSVFTSDVSGLVPAPNEANAAKVLNQLGNWITPPNTTYSVITTAEYNTVIAGNATSTTGRTITPKMLQDIINNANFNKAKKLSTPRYINGVMFDGTEDINISTGEVYDVFNSTTNGLVPSPNEEGTNKYLNQDGTWKTPTNTTYSLVTQTSITAGTETTGRLWSVKLMVDNFAKKDHNHDTSYATINHTHTEYISTTHATNEVTSTLISNWNTAYTNNHTHNQTLNTTNDVTFASVNGLKIGSFYLPDGNETTVFNTMFGSGDVNGIATTYGKFTSYGATLHWKSFDVGASLSVPPFLVQAKISSNRGWSRDLAFTDNPTSITATAFFTSSSISNKTNIKPYEGDSLKLIDELDIVTYDRTDEKSQKDMIGIIAEHTSKEFLSPNKDAVNIYNTVFILADAVQKLTKEIEQLKKQLNGR